MLQLARNAGTGSRYVEDVYYHHEAESKTTWETLNQNRSFREYMDLHKGEVLIPMEEPLEAWEEE